MFGDIADTLMLLCAQGREAHKAITNDELKVLFETPLFTGCNSESRRTPPVGQAKTPSL